MKRLWITAMIMVFATIVPQQKAAAQIPIVDIIKAAVKKAIKAVDLQIQRQQNKVIWLQNAQKTMENAMSKAKLDNITGWVEKQKKLYQDYYDELKQVKAAIAYYRRIRDITEKQAHMVAEYKRAWNLFRQDKHFTAAELAYMSKVYSGILDESVKNLDGLSLIVNSFQTQMSDARRLEIINGVATRLDEAYNDLKAFNRQGMLLSLQRARAQNDVDAMKRLYGLQ